jgi:iron(III) transport system ATP-binding protein
MTTVDPLPRTVAPAVEEAPVVRLRGVRKRFRRADRSVIPAVDGVDLDVTPGEFLVLLGPSGCGKTTLLRAIAGLETPDEGSIEIGGRVVFDAARGVDVAPERRGLSMMFQSYALWPHMTVAANVAYPLRHRRDGRPDRRSVADRVREALELVGVPELSGQYPGEISGGQQQRVALARALVAGDPLVLFDEPLSNVDAKVRERLRVELVAMQRRLGFAAVYVTHDQTEAMELATRIAVIHAGQVLQLGPPREIYERPATRYVANFVGVANEIPGTVVAVNADRVRLDTALGPVVGVPAGTAVPGQAAVAVWRPEHGVLSADDLDHPNTWRATRRLAMFAGAHTDHHLDVAGLSQRVWTTGAAPDGHDLWVSVHPDHVRVIIDEPHQERAA